MKIKISRVKDDFPIAEPEHLYWTKAEEIFIETYWSGEVAPPDRHFKARLLWSDTALYVRFEAVRAEPLIVSETPNLAGKTIGLWERDVCEIFVAPDAGEPRKYFEFEIAPTGEWLDLAIHQKTAGGERVTDWGYDSGVESKAVLEKDKITMALKIPWRAFGKQPPPRAGDVWRGNLFRCVGAGAMRGYLAWRPTMTEKPNFHVPEKFGEFEFAE